MGTFSLFRVSSLSTESLHYGRCLPNLHGPVPAGRSDLVPVRAKCHALAPVSMAAQGVNHLGSQLTDLDGRIGAAPNQAPAVGAECHTLDPTGRVAQEVPELPDL